MKKDKLNQNREWKNFVAHTIHYFYFGPLGDAVASKAMVETITELWNVNPEQWKDSPENKN